ncbi:MAG: PspC domain-containing protein [Rhodoferax sp.]|jgi:phage shock protein PspC (stress-responsive transcriptional regulator)|nr:PspC domain-containing protein [Rhodoferax sp.]MCL4737499.1 PspC domain-containing protein [Burkholderiaceae bacterium]MCP5288676.1 PspC domain-containing protein [Burkholderiaceae bacterium]
MGLADELTRLQSLRDSGALSDDEFQRAKARVLAGDEPAPGMREINRLRRSRSDRWIGGVCGGVAQLTGVDAWIWRLLVTLLALFGGTGLVIYLLLWIFVPSE